MENKKVVFMLGSPASGKSTVAKKKYSDMVILDCDEIKKEHPDYDPKNPSLVHEWSRGVLEAKFQEQILKDVSFVLDGTGANSDKMVRRIYEVKEQGFEVELVYVTVSLNTALKRNRERARTVLEEVVKEKYKDIHFSFELVAPHADKVVVINTEGEWK